MREESGLLLVITGCTMALIITCFACVEATKKKPNISHSSVVADYKVGDCLYGGDRIYKVTKIGQYSLQAREGYARGVNVVITPVNLETYWKTDCFDLFEEPLAK